MSGEVLVFQLVAEDFGGALAAQGLADRVLVEEVSWIDGEMLSSLRTWRGDRDRGFLKVKDIGALAKSKGIRAFGHFEEGPPKLEAKLYRKLLRLMKLPEHRPSALIICRDLDGEPERREGFDQALREFIATTRPFPVLYAGAQPESEAWRVSGFEPRDDAERERLKEERQRLGFDPRLRSHELTSKKPTDKKDAKRILNALTEGDEDRQAATLAEPLELLEARGAENGLEAYLRQVRLQLLPLVR